MLGKPQSGQEKQKTNNSRQNSLRPAKHAVCFVISPWTIDTLKYNKSVVCLF